MRRGNSPGLPAPPAQDEKANPLCEGRVPSDAVTRGSRFELERHAKAVFALPAGADDRPKAFVTCAPLDCPNVVSGVRFPCGPLPIYTTAAMILSDSS
jgi:hypothetical protein